MALNIKDRETEEAVRLLARRRGISLTEAVRHAVRSELDKDELSEEEKARRAAGGMGGVGELFNKNDIKAAQESLTREEDAHLLGHDENGLWS